jgi:hypothetical protein
MIVVVKNEDEEYLGLIETDIQHLEIQGLIDDSYKRELYSYDVDDLITDIQEAGYSASRIYPFNVEI